MKYIYYKKITIHAKTIYHTLALKYFAPIIPSIVKNKKIN